MIFGLRNFFCLRDVRNEVCFRKVIVFVSKDSKILGFIEDLFLWVLSVELNNCIIGCDVLIIFFWSFWRLRFLDLDFLDKLCYNFELILGIYKYL